MASISEQEEILEAAVAGIPRVAEVVASIPEEDREMAFEAAERSYLQTAHDLYRGEGLLGTRSPLGRPFGFLL